MAGDDKHGDTTERAGGIRAVRLSTLALALVVTAGLVVGGVAFAAAHFSGHASASTTPAKIVALGDSYTSGEGDRPSTGWVDDCHRSDHSWPVTAEAALRSKGWTVSLRNYGPAREQLGPRRRQ